MANVSPISILKKLNAQNISIADTIKEYDLWQNYSFDRVYDNITKIHAHRESKVSATDVFAIYKCIYDNWYNYLHEVNVDKLSPYQKSKIEAFLSMEKYKPENMTGEKCVNFIHEEYDLVLQNTNFRPMTSQSGNDTPIIGNNFVRSDFIHCNPFGEPYKNGIDCRLYINVKSENVSKLTEKLIEKCYKDKEKIKFKFSTNDTRNDTFLIYTTYDKVEYFINALKEIRLENPEIFDGCENHNPFLTIIDNFIGFSEDPKVDESSFTSVRATAIKEFIADHVEPEIIKERKRIGNYDGIITTSKGTKLTTIEYIAYKLEEAFKETIIKNHNEISNGYYPFDYSEHGRDCINSYIEIENKIYRTCLDEIPQFVKDQIKVQAKRYIDGLKNGEKAYIEPLKFPTKDMNLFPYRNKDILNQEIIDNKYLYYTFRINVNLQEILFSLFNSEENIEKVITDEALKPYLEKHNISSLYPSLNLETEELYNDQIL